MNKKQVLATAFVLVLLFSAVVGGRFVRLGVANPFYEERRTDPPVISIHSPTNETHVNNVLLNFTVTKPEWWVSTLGRLGYAQTLQSVSYEIDGKLYGSVGVNSNLTSPFNHFVYLANLTDGPHSLIVHAYATGFVVEMHGLWDYYVPINSSSVVYFTLDTTLPSVSIPYLENKTYYTTNVTLAFAVNEPTSWMGYRLDGDANVTVAGNTTLTDLSDGSHTLTFYAKDTAGNTGASETVYFSKAQQSGFLGSSLPMEYGYAIVAVTEVAIAAVTGNLFFKRLRRQKQDE